jgi:3-oxoacyl-[acyl-carrier-protein] synthase-3
VTDIKLKSAKIAGIVSAVPEKEFDNVRDTEQFDSVDVKKVVALAGVKSRRVSDGSICTSDLNFAAAERLLEILDWAPESISAVIFVTQTPDYFLPGGASLIHKQLKLPQQCAAFDVGLGCSGYPYGLWLANMMLQTGSAKRVLLLHGETPSLFTSKEDRSTYLLFGDGGTATAIEADDNGKEWGYCLRSDGEGYSDLIIPGGGFRNPKPQSERDYCLRMNGTNLFNFTISKVPELINDTLALMETTTEDVDAFYFHQSNQFIMKHIAKKCGLSDEKVPIILDRFGNIGGGSVPLAITQHLIEKPLEAEANAMLLGYGVGLSWGSACIQLSPGIKVDHIEINSSTMAALYPVFEKNNS